MNTRHCPTCYSNQFVEKPDGLHCAFCDNRYIEPKQRSDRQEMMLEIAYTDLRNMNFIEAESAFEEIIALYPDLHEAYWGCLSSRCGLKYEEDYSGKKIPTCCLPHMQSILEVSYYQKATALADPEIAAQYRDTAEYLERVRQTWVAHASKLPPYDIFISYKESDAERGLSRTEDSINAQELYVHLTRQGYRVFYSHDSLRDVVGEKYEPYIFHALETAKAMIVYGTKPEYINSTWLKNEWMRYMKKMEQGEKQKGSLIVVYEGFSPYELPGALRFQGIDGKSRSCYADIDDWIERLIPQDFSFHEEEHRAEDVRTASEAQNAEDTQKTMSSIEDAHQAELARIHALAQKAEDNRLSIEEEKANAARRAEELQRAQEKLWDAEGLHYSENLAFRINDNNTCSVIGLGSCRDEHVNIPPTYGGFPVTTIEEKAFRYTNLSSVNIPDGITYILNEAFANSKLYYVTIPDSVTYIADRAFYSCENLQRVKIPSNVKSISEKCFYCCSQLRKVEHTGAVHIHEQAFWGCSILSEVHGNVTYIGEHAFTHCRNLSHIFISPEAKIISESAFYNCSSLKNIIIPESISHICANAFRGCANLESITYRGSKRQWKKIKKDAYWDFECPQYKVICDRLF